MRKTAALFMIFTSLAWFANAGGYKITSPNGKLTLTVEVGSNVTWEVKTGEQVLIPASEAAIVFQGEEANTKKLEVRKTEQRKVSNSIVPVVPLKNSRIEEEYQLLNIHFRGNHSIEFRVYDEGIAYRFLSSANNQIIVKNEVLNLNLPENSKAFFPEEESLYSHYERQYKHLETNEIGQDKFCSLPVLFEVGLNHKVLFTEAGLTDYPNIFLKKESNHGFGSLFPKVVKHVRPRGGNSDRSEEILETEDYIAKTTGTRGFPWRVFIISEKDADLLTTDLVFQLSEENQIADPSWIKPGKVAWDWYNANNITGVDFKSGINTETYRYYIDFAADYGLEYIILDEGWSKSTTNILEPNPEIDLKELISYGNRKNVGIILWLLWHPLNGNEEEILSAYAAWGVKGVKVDFMQRADQYMVNSYEKIARIAAENKLLVDFHGAYKPSGLNRKYPNVLSFEGVMGNENNKWSSYITPEHNLTLPFTRMVAGPMDYTPGAMRNAQLKDHCINFDHPASVGTRAHQVAMYVVFESPLQMLCDAPSLYRKEPEVPAFISKIPVVWDETIAPEARIKEYLLMARRNQKNWYVAAMTNQEARNMQINLSFLNEGDYEAVIFMDGANADKNAADYKIIRQKVNNQSIITANLAPGGGWTAIFTPVAEK